MGPAAGNNKELPRKTQAHIPRPPSPVEVTTRHSPTHQLAARRADHDKHDDSLSSTAGLGVTIGLHKQNPSIEQGAEADRKSLRILEANVVSHQARTQVRARTGRTRPFLRLLWGPWCQAESPH